MSVSLFSALIFGYNNIPSPFDFRNSNFSLSLSSISKLTYLLMDFNFLLQKNPTIISNNTMSFHRMYLCLILRPLSFLLFQYLQGVCVYVCRSGCLRLCLLFYCIFMFADQGVFLFLTCFKAHLAGNFISVAFLDYLLQS
jgi:hypothetical protein